MRVDKAFYSFPTVYSSFLDCFQNETIQNLLHFYLSFWLAILCSSKPFSFPFPFVNSNTIQANICKYVCVSLPLIGKWQLFLVRQKGVKSSTLIFLNIFWFCYLFVRSPLSNVYINLVFFLQLFVCVLGSCSEWGAFRNCNICMRNCLLYIQWDGPRGKLIVRYFDSAARWLHTAKLGNVPHT